MRNYVKELRELADKNPDNGLYRELADYMNARLIQSNKTIFEFVPIDGVPEGKERLIDLIQELREKGFWDGN